MRLRRVWVELCLALLIVAFLGAYPRQEPVEREAPIAPEAALAWLPDSVTAVAVLRRPLRARMPVPYEPLRVLPTAEDAAFSCIPFTASVDHFTDLRRHVTSIVEGVVPLPQEGWGYYANWCCIISTDAEIDEEALRPIISRCGGWGSGSAGREKTWNAARVGRHRYLVSNDADLFRLTLARIEGGGGVPPRVVQQALEIHEDTTFWAIGTDGSAFTACRAGRDAVVIRRTRAFEGVGYVGFSFTMLASFAQQKGCTWRVERSKDWVTLIAPVDPSTGTSELPFQSPLPLFLAYHLGPLFGVYAEPY